MSFRVDVVTIFPEYLAPLRQVMTGVGGRGLRVDVVDTDGR